jgi:hypothetical protein
MFLAAANGLPSTSTCLFEQSCHHLHLAAGENAASIYTFLYWNSAANMFTLQQEQCCPAIFPLQQEQWCPAIFPLQQEQWCPAIILL